MRGTLRGMLMLAHFGSITLGELLVAIGTLALAGFTAWLAFETRSVATETEEDVRAEWRPVLIGAAGSEGLLTVMVPTASNLATVRVYLVNVGRGPAINTYVTVSSQTSTEEETSDRTAVGTIRVDTDFQTDVPGVLFRDSSAGTQSFLRYTVTASYGDLSGRRYVTVLTYDDPERGSRSAPSQPGLPPTTFEIGVSRTEVSAERAP